MKCQFMTENWKEKHFQTHTNEHEFMSDSKDSWKVSKCANGEQLNEVLFLPIFDVYSDNYIELIFYFGWDHMQFVCMCWQSKYLIGVGCLLGD